jgi:DNA invertase Pin-like site-specific DNA recombinase
MSKITAHVSNGQEKIRSTHLERNALVYLRQSSPGQVLHHRESLLNQTQMANRAYQLGWKQGCVHIIQTDLGQSGREATQRHGFQYLLSEVSLGRVGIIFGYEVSRLSRNNSDWYRLLELTAMFDTLIADYDGIYDLKLFNDRLLLGLKGTMSEAELHLMQLRLAAGRNRQLERGEYQAYLPTGYVRLDDGSVIKDPNERIRQVLDLLFAKFREVPSCTQLLQYFADHDIQLPRRQVSGVHKGDVIWKPARYGTLYEILTIPTYAGTFVYGRRRTQPGTLTRMRKSRDEWAYVHHNIYPAYLTWEEYLANQEKLKANSTISARSSTSASSASREGNALLQGLVYCGKCGHRMATVYKPHGRYTCQTAKRQFGQPVCEIIRADVIDDMVMAAFFEAIRPAQFNALSEVLEHQDQNYAQLEKQWQYRRQQAQYDTQRAQKQYNAVDPENRLVARELERRWEAALENLQAVEQGFDTFQKQRPDSTIPPELAEQFRQICQTLPQLWDQLPPRDKKDLLRSLIAKVILLRVQTDQVKIKIVWVSGHFSEHITWLSIHRNQETTQFDQLTQRIYTLWKQGLDDPAIAQQLTEEDFTSARLDHVSRYTVQVIRMKNRWLTSSSPKIDAPEGFVKVTDLAKRIQISPYWLYKRIRSGQISQDDYIRHPKRGVILIRDEPHIIEIIQKLKQT